MAITAFDHVQLAVPDGQLEVERDYLIEQLGFALIPRPATLTSPGYWLKAGSAILHLGADPDFHSARKAHPAFWVDDLNGLRGKLDAAGYETHDDAPVDGLDRFFTFDPVGNRLEFMTRV